MAEYIVNQYSGVFRRAEELYNEEKYKEAAQLFIQITENDHNNFAAAYYLGDCYYYGKGVAKDVKKAFQLFTSAALNKITEAEYMVGLCYLEGTGVGQDSTQAVAWFTEAAKYAHPLSQYYLGAAYMTGNGITKDIPRAAQWLVHAAKQGVVEAQRDAGICYEMLGKLKGAATLFLAGAEAGDSYCQERIADCYADGYGTLQCTELAVHYYELAANQNNVNAQVKMANRYAEGNGVEKSIKKAIYWWIKAAGSDNPEANYRLGNAYATGTGVLENYDTAMNYWVKAANLGYVEAMVQIADIYQIPPKEANIEQDLITSKYWWTKAAEGGNAYAMYRLGECFEKAIGIPQPNLDDAYRWYNLAAENGCEEAQESIQRFSKRNGKIKVKKQK